VQANRVVKLSDRAWAESVPNLEIENNDVRCAHASTVGPVDAEQRYYLESRGIPPLAAQRLVVGGFFDDALDHFPVPEALSLVGGRIDAELDRELSAGSNS
jgi:Fe-S cluster assembly protein SufD